MKSRHVPLFFTSDSEYIYIYIFSLIVVANLWGRWLNGATLQLAARQCLFLSLYCHSLERLVECSLLASYMLSGRRGFLAVIPGTSFRCWSPLSVIGTLLILYPLELPVNRSACSPSGMLGVPAWVLPHLLHRQGLKPIRSLAHPVGRGTSLLRQSSLVQAASTPQIETTWKLD